jgi:hypothetical protein
VVAEEGWRSVVVVVPPAPSVVVVDAPERASGAGAGDGASVLPPGAVVVGLSVTPPPSSPFRPSTAPIDVRPPPDPPDSGPSVTTSIRLTTPSESARTRATPPARRNR